MVTETLILIALSVITARLLEKRYKVASIFHAIFFIAVASYYLFVTDYKIIVDMWLNYIDPNYYYPIKEALTGSGIYITSTLHTLVLVEIVTFFFVPLLSIVAFIQLIRDEFKEVDINYTFKIDEFIEEEQYQGYKEFIPNNNDLYLKYQVLLN